jgi:vitamin B12 transporter
MKTLLGVLASLIFFSTTVIAAPQSSSADAQLRGTMLDSSGGGVGGVQVVARHVNDPQAHLWKATSTTDGAYLLTLPPGNYHVTFRRKPFATREFDLDLTTANSPRTLDLRLDLERISSSVVVTAQAQPLPIQQTTAPVDVITREEIAQRLAVTLPDALLTSPGIAIGRTGPEGGSASVFLNGGGSAYTKVLVDGTPVNEPGNAVDFANFTLDNVDKIEVVRGAESAVYGSDAVSGVIQVFTHRGTTRVPEVAIFAEGGNFDTGRGGAQLSGLIGNFDYSGAASYFSTNGPQDINAFTNRTLSGNFGYRVGEDNQLRLSLRNNTSNAQTPGQTLLEPPNPDSHTDYHFFSSNARWDFANGKHWHHQLMGAESYNRQFTADPVQSFYIQGANSFCPQDPTSPNAIATVQFCDFTDPGSRYRYNRASLNAQSSYLLENFGATAGYQYEVENAEIPFLAEGHVRRNNQAGFLDFRYSPHPRASLNFGARAEANGYFGTRVVPRAGASLALLQGRGFWGETRLRAFYGQGIKEPRFDQIFDDAFGDIGNPNLKPESSKTWTIGLDQKLDNDRLRLTGEYFSSRFYDMISFAFCDLSNTFCNLPPGTGPGFGFGYFFNTDRARARGTNITAEAKIARWLMMKGNYTYDDSLILQAANPFDPTQLPGNRLARRPLNSGSFTALASWRRFGAALSGYFSGQRTDSDFLGLNLTRTPGYARFDLAATYQFSRGISTYLRAANLFDKSYQDALGYPALGREVRLGMAYRLGGRN